MKDNWIDHFVDTVIKAIDTRIAKPTGSYFEKGTVLRVDKGNGRAWVHIHGGEPETPAMLTMDAKAGDTVQVRVGEGSATIVGNLTAPPTDDKTATEALDTAEDVKKDVKGMSDQIDQQNEQIEDAEEKADQAMTAANGKNKIYRQAEQPTGSDHNVGDTWFDTDDDNRIYHWDGTAWQPSLLGDDALDEFSANHITAGSIDASQVTISNLDAGNITTGQLDAQYIDASGLRIGDMINDADFITMDDVNLYSIQTNVDSISYDPTAGTISPGSITANTFNDGTAYAGRIRFSGSTNGTSWTTLQESSSNVSTLTYSSVSSSYKFYRVTLFEAGGTTKTLAIKTLPVVKNGEDVTSQYVTTIAGVSGITVHDAYNTSNFLNANSNGVYIYKGGVKQTGVVSGEMDFYSTYNNVETIPFKITYNTSSYRTGSVTCQDGNYKARLDLYAYNGQNATANLVAYDGTSTSNRNSVDVSPSSVSLVWHGIEGLKVSDNGSDRPLLTVRDDMNVTNNMNIGGDLKFNNKAPFTTFTATGSTGSISAGSGGHASCTGSVPSGYTIMGIQTVTTNHTFTGAISSMTLLSNGAYVDILNTGSSSQSFTVTVTMLCRSF